MENLADYAGAAQYLNTSERHVRALRERHELPFVRVGKLIRFRIADLDAYIESRTTPAERAG
jgi:excisionase family DNA binding protein